MDIGKTPQGGLIHNYRKGMMEWIIASMTALAVGEGIINNYKQWCNYKAYEK